MALKSLGKVTVTTAGTPVRLTANETTPTARVPAHAIFVQADKANGGAGWLGLSGMNKATGAGVLAVIPKPSASDSTSYPSISISDATSKTMIDASDVYLDADGNGYNFYVSVVIG